jgi:uncharacterized protein YecE (DUF72 family)
MTLNNSGSFYSGTSNLLLPVPNKQSYPPEFQDKSRLTYYSSLFTSIEINSSFYKIPMASTIRKWAQSVSDDFKFTFKLWREITHTKGLIFTPEAIRNFIHVINNVEDKKGCLLIQFPPSLVNDHIDQLEQLLIAIRNADPLKQWKIALEFRNPSWYNDETYDLLNQFDASVVLHDMPSSVTPFLDQPSDLVYLRFHGPNGGYRGSYNDDFLYEYAQYIKDWKEDGKMVFAYFNNSMGEAVKNLITLNGFVNR